MAKISVVHLVRHANGPDPFLRFIDSYKRYSAGCEHQLILIFKGFGGNLPSSLLSCCDELNYQILEVSDEGFDLHAYLAVAPVIDSELLCFLNSFCEVLADDWLRLLSAPFQDGKVGAVGVAGSWESHFNNHLRSYRELGWGCSVRSWLRKCWRALRLAQVRSRFAAFPNPHLRTSCFVIRRSLWLQFRLANDSKEATYGLESGRNGLYARLKRSGSSCVVTGRDGVVYSSEAWPQSRTYRNSDQENLLVTDRRTFDYEEASPSERQLLRFDAWSSAGESS